MIHAVLDVMYYFEMKTQSYYFYYNFFLIMSKQIYYGNRTVLPTSIKNTSATVEFAAKNQKCRTK